MLPAWRHPLELSPKAVRAVLGKRGFWAIGVICLWPEFCCTLRLVGKQVVSIAVSGICQL